MRYLVTFECAGAPIDTVEIMRTEFPVGLQNVGHRRFLQVGSILTLC